MTSTNELEQNSLSTKKMHENAMELEIKELQKENKFSMQLVYPKSCPYGPIYRWIKGVNEVV